MSCTQGLHCLDNLTPQQALQRITQGNDLKPLQMQNLMRAIMQGQVSEVMIAALIAALRTKEESAQEVSSAAQVLREMSTKVEILDRQYLVDIVGTGGDGAQTFNISTCTTFVACAAGARVSKHGGRSVSSNSGSADVLQALGVNLQLTPEQIAKSIEQIGVGFMFAPHHHPAMKQVAGVRRELGLKSIFNILGPLANPAGAENILMGVFNSSLLHVQVQALRELGTKRALVVHGKDGLDEISITAPTFVMELNEDRISSYELTPEQFGLQRSSLQALQALDAQASMAMLHSVLDNQIGAARDIVLLNAAAALYVAGVTPSMAQGLVAAQSAITSGAAKAKLKAFIDFTQQCA